MMVSYYKDFLLNIFFIYSPLVFYPYILKTMSSRLIHQFLLFILFSIALICTMSFPLEIDGLTYDFRSIPLTLCLLYGGPIISLLIYLTLILYRYLMGNPNSLFYFVSLVPTYFIIIWYLRKFNFGKLHQKIINSVFICTLIKFVTFTIYLLLTHNIHLLFKNSFSTLETYLLQGLIAGFYVYVVESLNKYFIIQEEVVKSEKMKIVSDIAASVAHEIRNPLTSVKGFIQLLGSGDLSDDKREFYAKISLEELDRALQIISDYLSIAKPEPENIEKIDLQDEVIYVSNVLKSFANYNNIQINTHVSEDIRLLIRGDRFKLRQALINIGKNGIEAMPKGGILSFRVNRTNNNIELTISDSGFGMTAEQVNRLGTPYYSTKEKGTGLGTMVSFGIIKKMEGKIQIKSEPRKGTDCVIIFPMVE